MSLDLDAAKDRFVFCGDSPNDAPMFSFFPFACGVANVKDFIGRIDALPAYISQARGGRGLRRDRRPHSLGPLQDREKGLTHAWPPSPSRTSARITATWR